MAEQLRIEWADDDRGHVHVAPQVLDLRGARPHEMPGMMVRRPQRPAAVVELLIRRATGNSVVFDTGEFPRAVARQGVGQMLARKIEADVAVEVPIRRIARITFFRAPDLAARFAIASKRRGAAGRKDRSVNGVARTRAAKHQAVRIEHEPAQFRLLQDGIEARRRRIPAARSPSDRARTFRGNGRAPGRFARARTPGSSP